MSQNFCNGMYGATTFGTRVDVELKIIPEIVAQAMMRQHGIVGQQPIRQLPVEGGQVSKSKSS